MGHGRIKCRAIDCDCNGSHVAERGRLRAARIGFTTTHKTAGTAKIRGSRTGHHSLWFGLWLEKLSMNSAAIRIFIFWNFVNPKDADSSDERGRSRVPGETGGSSPVARNGPSST